MSHIALFGGSFNPFHNAHLNIAITALHTLDTVQVQLIPAKSPWQKSTQILDAKHRIAMIQIAIRNNPKIVINTTELERDGLTYTIDTFLSLDKSKKYFWVMGSDQLQNFCSWHRWQEIPTLVDLLIAKRPSYTLDVPSDLQNLLDKLNKQITYMDIKEMPISSTEIRNKIINNQSTEGIIDSEVLKYIKDNNLYKI